LQLELLQPFFEFQGTWFLWCWLYTPLFRYKVISGVRKKLVGEESGGPGSFSSGKE
jgi:hypothetical protein